MTQHIHQQLTNDSDIRPAVSAKNVSKSYRSVRALNDVSFDVNKGEIFGIIGPDGAGKTTLFRILNTLLLADSGTVTVDGYDVVKEYKSIRKVVGYMPGRFSLYQDLSVEENLKVFASIFKVSIADNYHLIKDIYQHLEPFKKRKAGKLSGGMKQKLALSCALIHKPHVLFLDEPTTGVDPVSRKEFWDMLKRLKAQGITILVSTPYMDEANLCDRIALIMNGEFLKIETPEQIIDDYDQTLWSVRSDNMLRLLNDLRDNPIVRTNFAFGETYHITLKEPTYPAEKLKEYLSSRGHSAIKIKKIKPTVEDCFMELTIANINQHE